MNSNRESEEGSSRRWVGGLGTWFRNLSNLKKAVAAAVTVAGGVGAILGAVNGVIALVETMSDDAGKVTSEKPGNVTSEEPIRVEYQYLNGPYDGVIPIELDPNVNPSDYLSLTNPGEAKSALKGKVAFTEPFVWIFVTSQVEDETVSLAPYLVLEVTEVTPMPETVNYTVYTPAGGAGGKIDYFVAALSPEREGVFYAPQWTADTALGSFTPPPALRKTDQFFTLAPDGETEFFTLQFIMLPGYYYHFRVGVQYSYRDRRDVVWSDEFAAGVPFEATVWLQTGIGYGFERYGDLQSFEEYMDARGNSLFRPLPRYDESEIEKVIHRQEETILKYGYPYTPPEQFD